MFDSAFVEFKFIYFILYLGRIKKEICSMLHLQINLKSPEDSEQVFTSYRKLLVFRSPRDQTKCYEFSLVRDS